MANVLVVGGAGYVGSAACAWLLDQGHSVHVLDNLSTGHRILALGTGFTRADAGDSRAVGNLLASRKFDCVMHFAARSLVAESVSKRDEYFENNVEQTRRLLETMLSAGVNRFIFSSTCAIFGDPGDRPMDESLPKKPISPYGETKLEAERVIGEFSARGLKAVSLRYFNAAGAEPRLRVGEWHEPESHLIPNVLKAAIENVPMKVFGNDYATSDGTCVRDYIHVTDLARAHESAMLRLLADSSSAGRHEQFNLGSENGFTVLEVIRACEEVTGRKLQVEHQPRRAGDPPRLVAASALAKKELGFGVGPDSLKKIVLSAWQWEQKRRAMKKAVFLDRDGTVNRDPGYLREPGQMNLLPGVGDALAALKKAGFLLVVVSNQSGVSRGLVKAEDLPRIHARLDELLAPFGVKIDQYELCFHHPDEDCDCRKPKPRLLLDAARALGIDPERSFMVGDKISDVEAGRNASCRASILVRTGDGAASEKTGGAAQASVVVDSLSHAVDWILAQRA